ncbi:MAG: hypothetical protein J2P18_04795 [Nocardia sp.]|nr:hypothetical protein [Nocardia sp.]
MAPLLAQLDELLQLTRSAERTDLAARLSMARARLADPRVRLVVVGEPKHGMSTLVNGLVGSVVSATDSPLSVPVVAEYGSQATATLVRALADGRTERTPVNPLDPGAAFSAEGVVRAEFTDPSPLLAEGFVVMDAPGAGADIAATWSLIAAADAVLYVTDAAHAYTDSQITMLRGISQVCPAVVCVLNKIDLFPRWNQVQQRNRELLDDAELGFAVAPISARLHLRAGGDRRRDLESGVPQLIDHLRAYVLERADAVAWEAALRDIRTITDHLGMALRSEAETLRDPRRFTAITNQLRSARDEADQLRRRTAHWQLALADGCAELMADSEHDLRHRLRVLVRDAEDTIATSDPAKRWDAFGAELNGKINDAVEQNLVSARARAVELAAHVTAKFPGEGSGVPDPDLEVDDAADVLRPVAPLESLATAKVGIMQSLLNVMRGSYGGLLMVGMLTSLLKMPLVNWYSGAAAALLGINALWEDRKLRRERNQAAAKTAVARLMDDVIFQTGKETRYRLRAVQRGLRDHFTDLADQTLRSVDESLRAAEEAAAVHSPERRESRLIDIEHTLVRLREIRETADSA